MRHRPATSSLLALAIVSATPTWAASYRLDSGQSFSAAWSAAVSPDGAWVVYAQDVDDDEARELWKAPVDGGAPVRLTTGLLPVGAAALVVAISPDSSQVLFRAPMDNPGRQELYRAPLNGGGGATKLSGGQFVDRPTLSRDGSRVVWIENAPPGGNRLYSRPADGSGSAVALSPATDSSRGILTFDLSPDSAWVVFAADHTEDGREELYSVPIAGGTIRRLCGTMVAGGELTDPWSTAISADSNRVVYQADQLVDGRNELFAAAIAPPDGAQPLKLSGPMAGGIRSFALTANGLHAIYLADQQLAGRVELYSAPVSGGTAVKLSPALGATDELFDSFRLSPDSARVVFGVYRASAALKELWSVPPGGPAASAVLLTQWDTAGGHFLTEWKVSPDSARLVYRGSLETSSRHEVWSVPLDASAPPTKLNPAPLVGTWDTQSFAVSPDASRVFLVHSSFSSFTQSWSERLFDTPIAGGPARTIAGPFDNPEPWNPLQTYLLPHPDSRRVLWTRLPPDQPFASQVWIGDSTLFSEGFEAGLFLRWSAKRP